MTTATPSGWGGGAWGITPWGGSPTDLFLMGAVAVRENVVRLTFSVAPVFTGILDPHDASNRFRYSVANNPNTTGADGLPARPVSVVMATQAPVAGAEGKVIDVTVDRPFSPYAAKYRVTANNLIAGDGTPLNPAMASVEFYGVQRERVPAMEQKSVRSRDIANPFVASSITDNLLTDTLLVAGAFSADAGGDLALDEGLVSVKKWILRTMITAFGGFVFLPTYGVNTIASIKRLSTAVEREKIASRARAQIARHPLIAKVAINFFNVKPGFLRLQVVARTKTGAGLKVERDFQVSF